MVERDQWGGVSTGVATQDAAANPEWYLKNTSGQRFTFRHYDWIWAADVGNPGFQQKWADNVLAEVTAKGWDGVFMDDINPSIECHYDVASVAKYPTNAAYQAATGSALAAIGARFRAAGKLVIPNFGFWKDYPTVIKDWLRHVDGGMNEMFVKVGSDARRLRQRRGVGDASCSRSRTRRRPASTTSASRTRPTTTARPPATATRRCCSAATATRTSRCTATTRTRTGSRSTTTRSGAPRRPRRATRAASTGAASANGLVLVNPTGASVRVDFGGAYTGSGLSGATGTTMAPQQRAGADQGGTAHGSAAKAPRTAKRGKPGAARPGPGPDGPPRQRSRVTVACRAPPAAAAAR